MPALKVKSIPPATSVAPAPDVAAALAAKGNEYSRRVGTAAWDAFIAEFKAISAEPGIDYSLLNKAATGAFLDCAAKIAVDEGLHEDVLAAAVRRAHRAAYAAAPKFG